MLICGFSRQAILNNWQPPEQYKTNTIQYNTIQYNTIQYNVQYKNQIIQCNTWQPINNDHECHCLHSSVMQIAMQHTAKFTPSGDVFYHKQLMWSQNSLLTSHNASVTLRISLIQFAPCTWILNQCINRCIGHHDLIVCFKAQSQCLPKVENLKCEMHLFFFFFFLKNWNQVWIFSYHWSR